ncbi:MAG: lipid-A-disaccharide synthase [Phycisphaerae bacterium]
MSNRPVTIFLSAAEASGDEHAARLIAALRRRLPDARFVGVAGEKMAAEGCEVVADLTHQAGTLGGPILKAGYWLRTVARLRRSIREIRPDVHVPVDSPALNWHLAAAARRAGASVVYYIAPQVWAWAPWRVRKLARLTNAVACILPFEEPYLRHRGVNATYVGHPLLESLPQRGALPDLLDAWAEGNWRIALVPGSRSGEIKGHTKALLAAARTIRRRWPGAQCTFTARTLAAAQAIRRAIGATDGEGLAIAVGKTRQVLAESHFAVVVSGTVTLEVAYFGVPMVVFYRVGSVLRAFRWLLGKWAVPTPHFSLVNILAGRRIVPELMPWHGQMRPLVEVVSEVMGEVGYLLEARKDLLAVVDTLRLDGAGCASDNAADLIVNVLGQRGSPK